MEARRAAKYRRISDDREGRELGIDRQDEDLDDLGNRRGLSFVADYADNDIGASTRSKKPRPGYQQMIADAKAGRFEVIAAYTTSRVTRRPREFEDLIELAEKHSIEFMYVRSPEFDLTTAQGRRIARILAANDAGESEDIAERVARAARQRAEAGEFHGGHVTFGYQKTATGIEPHPVHSGWVREAVRRLLAGETLYGICVDWNASGRRTGWPRRDHRGEQNNTWYPRTLKRVVTIAVIAGYREYQGTLYEAQWDPIVDRDDWARLRTLLTADERRTRDFGAGARKYELSGLVFCATCERVMVSMTASRLRGPSFICNKLATGGCGQMRIAMQQLEHFIEQQVFAVVDLRDATPPETPAEDPTATALRRAISQDNDALTNLDNDRDDGLIPDRATYVRRRNRIADRLQANREALDHAIRATARVAIPDDLRGVWATKDNVWRRTILGAVIDRIYVSRHPAGVASTLTRRRDETAEEHRARVDRHTARVLEMRTDVRWLA